MANRGFVDAVEVILKHEGGFVNHPADKGGPTNWGITQSVYEAYKGRKVTIDEMRRMPRSEAVAIYKRNYWDKVGGDSIKFYSVALTLFDQAVNRGVGAVVKQAQRVLKVPETGVMGPQTLAALNAVPDSNFLTQFLAAAEASYKAIVDRNPSQVVFLNGWMNRVKHLRDQASRFFGQLNAKDVGLGVGVIAILGVAGYFAYQAMKKKGR